MELDIANSDKDILEILVANDQLEIVVWPLIPSGVQKQGRQSLLILDEGL